MGQVLGILKKGPKGAPDQALSHPRSGLGSFFVEERVGMPLCDGREHQRSLVLPTSAQAGPDAEVFLVRFTGEVFDNYT